MKNQSESLKSFDFPFMPGVEVIFGVDIVNEFRRHIHKTFIVGLVTEGKRIVKHEGGTSQISRNEMFVINPGQVHSCCSEGSHSYKVLSVSSQLMQSIASEISEKQEKVPCFKRLHYENVALCNKLIKLFEVVAEPESGIQVESDFYSFFGDLIINFSESPLRFYEIGDQSSVKRVCDYISQNFLENLSLQKLAKIACLSPFHFQREFKKRVGITPHEYWCDIRIARAKKMLLQSENIADVAIQLGFFDQSHFSKTFKKTVGVSPGRYIKFNRYARDEK